ncbi:TOTE conflict system archaeo-eukaryotic primase domain-containing protein [Streptomyces sp. NPDC051546]|uniref:TOTE conflict system archaeo-eukaryotic primase domain-containing protein n=1 Tax=Streptomyces sp. NPDC051546 TaxID=3365655 RepID=UPI00379124CF
MDDWVGWDDPAELRVRLDMALEEIAGLGEENRRLRALLGPLADSVPVHGVDPEEGPPGHAPALDRSTPQMLSSSGLPYADGSSGGQEKLALFRALFVGRSDVFARPWANSKGRSGWSPATEKPPWELREGEERVLLTLSDQALFDHLTRPEPGMEKKFEKLHAGLYPLLPDDTCQLLACDFDKGDWRGDAAAYYASCQAAGVPASIEVSRSGQGAHVWTFFSAPVAAVLARDLGAALLRDAISSRKQMSLASFDRFFPAQDLLPTKAHGDASFGNLIALPLNGLRRQRGTTLFLDPATWEPFADQFAYLSQIRRLTPAEVECLVEDLGPVEIGPARTTAALPPKPRRGALGKAPETVEARLGAMLSVSTAGLPAPLLAALKHLASLHNPAFYKKQALRYSTFGTPRFVTCFDATDPMWLRLPRGLRDETATLVASAQGILQVTDELPIQEPISASFAGVLTPVQNEALAALRGHPTGVLVAPPGTGKTVLACAMIAEAGQPAAIIVNKAELLAQWRQRLDTFLELGDGQAVGSLGGSKDRRGGVVDLFMLQSLSHRDAPAGLLDAYGLVIVDECHTIGAPSAAAAVNDAPVRLWRGLSATPYRADQMDAVITMQCGPIRHEIPDQTTFVKHLIVHRTDFTTNEVGSDGVSFQALYGELATDPDRNALIASDIADAARRGRHSLALSNRIEHLHRLDEALRTRGVTPMLLHGGLASAERSAVRTALDTDDGTPLVLLAIDKVAGEGFDAPRLDALFLVSPFKFRGKSIQLVGRVMRELETGKADVEVHDYVDSEVSRLESMHHYRRRVLERKGFALRTAPTRATSDSPPAQAAQVQAGPAGQPSVSEVRAWARDQGHNVPDRGRLRAELWTAWHAAQPQSPP